MSQYLILSKIDVQNANAIAGLTWGFPAITSFLGFTHALSRKLSTSHNIHLKGCAVVSNKTQNKVYKPKAVGDFEFLQSKNPPVLAKNKDSLPPIIEEGKMNMTVSLVIEIANPITISETEVLQLEVYVHEICSQMRIAGGSVFNINKVKLVSASTQEEQEKILKIIKRLTMPGFVLMDKSLYLQTHFQSLKDVEPNAQLLDAWLDFIAMRYQAVPTKDKTESQLNSKMQAQWQYQPKPNSGYLVPIMTGYKAISERYDEGIVGNTRDEVTPTQFVEAIHSVGEWKSAHSIQSISDVIWFYEYSAPWYICTQYHDALTSQANNDKETTINN